MTVRLDLLRAYEEWCTKAENDLQFRRARGLCETTRMLLGIMSLLDAYFPHAVTREQYDRVEDLFERALACVTEQMDAGIDPDGCCDLYQHNIEDRIADLKELIKARDAVAIEQEA